MEPTQIVVYSIALVLNVLFGWLGSRWMAKKGYPEYGWIIWLASIVGGFIVPLIVVSILPGRGRPVKRRPLVRKLPQARMPQPRGS
jgi:hypothetical protein